MNTDTAMHSLIPPLITDNMKQTLQQQAAPQQQLTQLPQQTAYNNGGIPYTGNAYPQQQQYAAYPQSSYPVPQYGGMVGQQQQQPIYSAQPAYGAGLGYGLPQGGIASYPGIAGSSYSGGQLPSIFPQGK